MANVVEGDWNRLRRQQKDLALNALGDIRPAVHQMARKPAQVETNIPVVEGTHREATVLAFGQYAGDAPRMAARLPHAMTSCNAHDFATTDAGCLS